LHCVCPFPLTNPLSYSRLTTPSLHQLLLLRRIPRSTPHRPLPLRLHPKLHHHNTPHLQHPPPLPPPLPNTPLHPRNCQRTHLPPRPLLPRHRLRRLLPFSLTIHNPRLPPPPTQYRLLPPRRKPRSQRSNPPRCPRHLLLRTLTETARQETIFRFRKPVLESRLLGARIPVSHAGTRAPTAMACTMHEEEIP